MKKNRGRKKTFWNVTKRDLKSNIQCAFCKKERCPMKFDPEAREMYVCDVEMERRIKKIIL